MLWVPSVTNCSVYFFESVGPQRFGSILAVTTFNRSYLVNFSKKSEISEIIPFIVAFLSISVVKLTPHNCDLEIVNRLQITKAAAIVGPIRPL